MSDISKDVSYLKGLADGMRIGEDSNEGKLILELIKVADTAAERIEELEKRIEELEDELEQLDEEVYDLSMEVDNTYDTADGDDDTFYFDYDDDDDL